MSDAAIARPPVLKPAPPPQKVLRRLFLTLFVRGRSARGLQRTTAPKSVATKLWMTLAFYGIFGAMYATGAWASGQPLFGLSFYLHSATLIFLGMFVASSAGEVLFNKEEADILLHRPLPPGAMLWAKVRVLVEVSLWLAGAFNLAGFIVGTTKADGGWLFPVAHALSTTLEALLCAGGVVLVYQLCLRWFGRERLDGLMTTAQVFFAIIVVTGSQLAPRLMMRYGGTIRLDGRTWWVALVPSAWFAGLDDALAGSGAQSSWMLAGVGLLATALVMWTAFGKLAGDYETGLQRIGETISKPKRPRAMGRRWMDVLLDTPPLRWWLRDPASRASFRLVIAYLTRDRDVKLRIYPGLAPVMIMPFIFLLQPGTSEAFGKAFGVAFSGAYLGLVPMMSLNLLKYSQQWQASDIFRAAPITGPMPLCDGARRAVLLFLTLPLLLVFCGVIFCLKHDSAELLLLLPGTLALPVYALVPSLMGAAVPLSLPTEEARSTSRGLRFFVVMIVSMAVSGLATWAWATGWFCWLLLGEAVLVAATYVVMRTILVKQPWDSLE